MDEMALAPGDALYARRAGNRSWAWYVVDEAAAPVAAGYVAAAAHREHGAGRTAYHLFPIADIRHVDRGRYARESA